MRIIAGRFRGFKLAPVPAAGIRPTADRVREAVFSIIGEDIQGESVLDLFAGTGALGIEAMSRGADSAVFVDNHPEALSLLKKNIAKCGLEPQSRIIRANALQDLRCLFMYAAFFDRVFLDPPYGQKAVDEALSGLAQAGCLKPGAHLVCEHRKGEEILFDTAAYRLTDCRKYGNTLVSFFEFVL